MNSKERVIRNLKDILDNAIEVENDDCISTDINGESSIGYCVLCPNKIIDQLNNTEEGKSLLVDFKLLNIIEDPVSTEYIGYSFINLYTINRMMTKFTEELKE